MLIILSFKLKPEKKIVSSSWRSRSDYIGRESVTSFILNVSYIVIMRKKIEANWRKICAVEMRISN